MIKMRNSHKLFATGKNRQKKSSTSKSRARASKKKEKYNCDTKLKTKIELINMIVKMKEKNELILKTKISYTDITGRRQKNTMIISRWLRSTNTIGCCRRHYQ
jgi:hypothetical protein